MEKDLIDKEFIDQMMILSEDDPNFLPGIFESMRQESSEALEMMELSCIENNHDELAQIAHKAIGAFSFVGAKAIVDVLRKIEIAAKKKLDHEEIQNSIEMYKEYLPETITALREAYQIPASYS